MTEVDDWTGLFLKTTKLLAVLFPNSAWLVPKKNPNNAWVVFTTFIVKKKRKKKYSALTVSLISLVI